MERDKVRGVLSRLYKIATKEEGIDSTTLPEWTCTTESQSRENTQSHLPTLKQMNSLILTLSPKDLVFKFLII